MKPLIISILVVAFTILAVAILFIKVALSASKKEDDERYKDVHFVEDDRD